MSNRKDMRVEELIDRLGYWSEGAINDELKARFSAQAAEITRLKAEVEGLKCCGNCADFENCEDCLVASFRCKDWSSDNKTASQRDKYIVP